MKRWARAAVQGAACGLVLGLVVLIGGRFWWPQVAAAHAKQPAVAEVVRATRFEVEYAGEVRAVLHPWGLWLLDEAGNHRVDLGLGGEGSPSLKLRDKAGTSRAVLGATSLETIKTEEVTMRPESSPGAVRQGRESDLASPVGVEWPALRAGKPHDAPVSRPPDTSLEKRQHGGAPGGSRRPLRRD